MPLTGAVSVEVTMRADAAGAPIYWHNRWEVSQALNGTFANPQAVAQAFATFHRQVLLANFWVDSVRLSTYVPDGEPYNPDSLYVQPVAARGQHQASAPSYTALPLTDVLHVRKLVAAGRLGHLFLRGFLTEADIASDPNSGSVSLIEQVGIQEYVSGKYVALAAAMPTGTAISLISGDGLILQSRDVTGIQVAGVSHRSFRSRRKTRAVSNAVGSLSSILQDGAVSLAEVPALIEAIGTVVRSIGGSLPPLLP